MANVQVCTRGADKGPRCDHCGAPTSRTLRLRCDYPVERTDNVRGHGWYACNARLCMRHATRVDRFWTFCPHHVNTPAPSCLPPCQTLAPCQHCNLTVLVAKWMQPDATHPQGWWQKMRPSLEPISEQPHDCTLAQARWALIERMQAGEVEVRPGTQGREWVDLATGEVIELGQEERI